MNVQIYEVRVPPRCGAPRGEEMEGERIKALSFLHIHMQNDEAWYLPPRILVTPKISPRKKKRSKKLGLGAYSLRPKNELAATRLLPCLHQSRQINMQPAEVTVRYGLRWTLRTIQKWPLCQLIQTKEYSINRLILRTAGNPHKDTRTTRSALDFCMDNQDDPQHSTQQASSNTMSVGPVHAKW